MRFGLFLAAAGLAAAQVSTVISDLNSIKAQTDKLTAALKAYPGGIKAGVPILDATNALKKATMGAISAAQGAGTVSTSDQADVLKAAEALYPSIIASLDATVADAGKFKAAGLSGTATSSLKSLQGLSAQLSSVLASKATGAYKTAATTLGQNIASAFSSALAGQAPQAMSLPTIPSGGSSGSSGSGSSSSAASSKPATSASSKAASSAAASTYSTPAASTPAASTPAASTPAPAPATSAPAPVASAPAPSYTGAAGKHVANVGGAVLLAAAAFAL